MKPRLRRCWPAALPLAVAACSGSQTTLDPAADQASGLLSLLQLMTVVCGGMYVLVLCFLAFALWRRRGPGGPPADVDASATPGDDRRLARGLVGWSALIVVGLTGLVIASFVTDRGLAAARSDDALDVRITGHQWWWRIEYRDPVADTWVETANELHLPAGRTARLALGAADVIHSFWVPNVAGKMDMIPGRPNVLDVTPRRIGWFRGQCAEFCGAEHARMALDVKVESPAEFAAWLADQRKPAAAAADPVAARGMRIVVEGPCGQCHVVRGTAAAGRPGPDLTHLGSRRSLAAGALPMSRGALQGWIAGPQAVKPGTTMPRVALDGADADAVSHYLETLR